MHKILVIVNKKSLSFSLYASKNRVDNLNDTNVVNTEKMIFSDDYIRNNLDLVKSFFNLIVIKKNINTVDVKINAIFPLVYKIIEDIPSIININLLEDKTISYVIFEYLLQSKYLKNINCYSIPSFMFDKLDIDKEMKVTSRCEVLFLSQFMERNNFNTYSDVYYKKSVDIDCDFDNLDQEDIASFFRFNNNLRVINLYDVNEKSINYILEQIKVNNKKNVKIILNQKNTDRDIIDLSEKVTNKNKHLIKNNNLRIKVNYTKEYRDKNTLKQVNLNFFRFLLCLFIILAIACSIIFYERYEEDTDGINAELGEIDKAIDLNMIDSFNAEDELLEEEPIEEEVKQDGTPSPYYRNFDHIFSELLKINDETVGWLKVNNTNINYPVVQHSDNDYYLNNSYYKQKNSHGWIFMDYRNKIDNLNKNTIIYGHRNNYGIMFANLKDVLNKSWYTNKDNQIITFDSLRKNMRWQIFSIYTLKNTNDYLSVYFNSDKDYSKFLNKIKKRSIYDFKVDLSAKDNILTLSTCYNNAQYRLVVHAKLLK